MENERTKERKRNSVSQLIRTHAMSREPGRTRSHRDNNYKAYVKPVAVSKVKCINQTVTLTVGTIGRVVFTVAERRWISHIPEKKLAEQKGREADR